MPFHFDLVDLRLIVRVADTGNLTRSADASHISLPAASARIRKMEDDVGAKLLYRSPQGVTLTPAGQALVHHARLMLAQMEHLHGDLQEYGKGVKGHLRLFANTTASSEFLPPVLRTFLGSHPGINIDFRELPSQDIVRAVVEGQTDLGIVAAPVHAGGPHTIGYRRDRLVVVVPA